MINYVQPEVTGTSHISHRRHSIMST